MWWILWIGPLSLQSILPRGLPSYTTETGELTSTLPRHPCNKILDETKYYMTFGKYKWGTGYLCAAFIDQKSSRDENAKTLFLY